MEMKKLLLLPQPGSGFRETEFRSKMIKAGFFVNEKYCLLTVAQSDRSVYFPSVT
jgi:hypothetical protein